MTPIQQRFRQFIKAEVGTQERAAEVIGTSTRHISEVCNGRVDPTIHDIIVLYREFGLDPMWLMFGEKER